MSAETHAPLEGTELGPISPELVLVTPDLRPLARLRLPDPGEGFVPPAPSVMDPPSASLVPSSQRALQLVETPEALPPPPRRLRLEPVEWETAEPEPPPAPRPLPVLVPRREPDSESETEPEPEPPPAAARRIAPAPVFAPPPAPRSRALQLVAVGLVLGALGGYFGLRPVLGSSSDSPRLAGGAEPSAHRARTVGSRTRPAAGGRSGLTPSPRATGSKGEPKTRAPKPRRSVREQVPTLAQTPARKPGRDAARPVERQAAPKLAPKPVRETLPVPAGPRIFLWAPAPRATYYNVQLFRGTKKVLELWPATTKVSLSPTWSYKGRRDRLVPGLYSWYVWPGFGAREEVRYGKLLKRQVFEISPT